MIKKLLFFAYNLIGTKRGDFFTHKLRQREYKLVKSYQFMILWLALIGWL
jgi:hypothetical protein